MPRWIAWAAVAAMIAVAPGAAFAQSQDEDPDGEAAPANQPSQSSKCDIFRTAFDSAVQRFGKAGLSEEFLTRGAAFSSGGCEGQRNVCPRSPEELKLANLVILRAVGRTGGSFLPFACPPKAPE